MITDDQIVTLADGDCAAALLLSMEAGWNQTLQDWRTLLQLGRGFGVRDGDAKLIATAIALPHAPDFGWIGMVLVTTQYRGRGLATKLLQRTIEHLMGLGLVPMLDATPAGRPVYERLGFMEIEGISRWRRAAPSSGSVPDVSLELSPLLPLDSEAFGADRSALLAGLVAVPGSRLIVDPERHGYAICRRGRTATHIGPVVAPDASSQARLLETALIQAGGPVIVDVPNPATALRASLSRAGLVIERPLTRMALGRNAPFGAPQMIAAIAGPEFG